MRIWSRVTIACLAVAMILVGCTPAAGQAPTGQGSAPQPAAKKRIVAAFIKPDLLAISALPTDSEGRHIVQMVHAGLAQEDDGGRLFPQVADPVPTVENGQWQVLPDGGMEMTWKLRADARWHDGTPVTAKDFVFGAMVSQDQELGFRDTGSYRLVEGIEAKDGQTLSIRFKQPFIEADYWSGSPDRLLPAHFLEDAYTSDRVNFMEHPYWTDGYIGAGPYKLKEYARGSHATFEAFDGYFLGRPKVDEIELRFIADSTTLIANLLAGAIDMTLGLSVAPDQAQQVKEQWREGTVITSPFTSSSVATFPQMLTPALPVIHDIRFRRAMLHAIDRQEMVDTIMLSQGGVAHTVVPGLWREYEPIQDAIVRYEYDPRKAAQLLEEVGYHKGGAGIYEDSAGRRLAFEHWGIQEEQERVRATFVVTDFWKKLGLDVEPNIIPAARSRDRELGATFPAFMVRGVPGSYSVLESFYHGKNIPTAENGWRGNNRARYVSGELDAAIDRFSATIPFQPRVQVLKDVVRQQSEQAVWMGLFYAVYNTMVSNKLQGVTPGSNRAKAFNAHLWDVR